MFQFGITWISIMGDLQIIPFGKYKGKPIEVLKQDKEYVNWLQTQDWFNLRYQSINTLIVNNFGEPSETQEHNKIQTLFLDEDFCKKVVNFMLDNNLLKRTYTKTVEEENPNYSFKPPRLEDYANGNIPAKEPRTIKVEKEFEYKYKFNGIEFERNSIDVMLDYTDALLCFEIKPHLSDDYPAVLRQMVASRANVLLIGSFGALGATLEQVKQIFFKSRIRVLLLTDFHQLD